MKRNEDEWINEYERRDALWMHKGNPLQPHAELTSGNHSTGFFNSEIVMQDPMLVADAMDDVRHLMVKAGCTMLMPDRVVGPAMGAITLAHSLALAISIARRSPCLRAYTEPVEEGGKKRMIFKKTNIKAGEYVLLVEDVVTTGTSFGLAEEAVLEKGGIVLPFVVTLVNRSGLIEVNGKKIIALINKPMPMWEPHECPLCKQGSVALRPKLNDHWQRLNATY
jgi:orotate phosphoribosyltransferase